MENSNNVADWKEQISVIAEAARVDGFALVGFALRPDDNALLALNNQGMAPLHFLAFMQNAMRAYMTTLPDDVLQKLTNAAEA